MYEKIKIMVAKYPRHYYIIGALIVLLGICAGYILYQPSGVDYHDSINTVERIESQQRKSLDLNQGVQNAVDRSIDLNRQSTERIERIEKYQRATIQRIDESQERLTDAERLLERNEQIFRDIESRPQAQQGDRKTP